MRSSAIAATLAVGAMSLTTSWGSGASLTTYHAHYYYDGQEEGRTDAYGRVTSFSPITVIESLTWLYAWTYECDATATAYGSSAGTTLGCNAMDGRVSGYYSEVYTPPTYAAGCSAIYFPAPGAVLQMGGTFANAAGTRLHVTAYPPPNGAVLEASHSCGYPPGNLVFDGSITVNHVLDLTRSHSQELYNSANGELTGFEGPVHFSWAFGARVGSQRGLTRDALDAIAGEVSQWIGDQVNGQRTGTSPSASGGTVIEYTDLPEAGTVGVIVDWKDPVTVLSLNQGIGANALTALHLSIAPATLRRLAAAAGTVTLDISVTFTPAAGSPVTFAGTFTPQLWPVISSVSFAGTPAAPVITLHGSSLAAIPAPDPATLSGSDGCPVETGATGYDYGPQLSLTDFTGNWGAGQSLTGLGTDCIGLIPSRASSSSLTLRLGSFYTSGGKFVLKNGDEVQVSDGGALRSVHVDYGHTVTR